MDGQKGKIPGISVIIPAYNAEKTLQEAVQSVLNQTYTNFELIIVDDCSTDGTAVLASRLEKVDSRIRVLHNENNSGVSVTRNNGVAHASFPWIAFLDSDDLWAEEKLQKQVRVLDTRTNAQLIFTGTAFVDDMGHHSDYIFHVPEYVKFQKLLLRNVISCSSVLVRRELLEHWPMYPDANIHEDYAVWLQILREIPCAIGIDEPLLVYRVSSGSKSGNKAKSARMQWNTYRYMGISKICSLVYFASYALCGLRKHHAIVKHMH